jgi:hypothetical protein
MFIYRTKISYKWKKKKSTIRVKNSKKKKIREEPKPRILKFNFLRIQICTNSNETNKNWAFW